MVAADKKDRLAGRRLWIPRMTYAGARMAAAAFRSVGVDAAETPESDDRTLELGALHSSGEECYPAKITLGDFLRIVEADDFDPDHTAFFMPTAQGPCRFGQYGPYLRQLLDKMGHHDVPIISPTSGNSYDDLARYGRPFIRRLWRGIVAGDILLKMLLKTRPYETEKGAADAAFEKGLNLLEQPLQDGRLDTRQCMAGMVAAMDKAREVYEAVPARYTTDKLLIGVVGEIFCRLNTFSNFQAIRRIEAHGGEAWLSDVAEWVFYTNWCHQDNLKRQGKGVSLTMLGVKIKNAIQRKDEHALLAPWTKHIVGYEEPHSVYEEVLKPGWPYLPADGTLGEMVLSVGKTVYLHGKGADGIIDISPFTCMNGIVSEAVYHDVARDHDDMPIRNFYFDDSNSNMDRDLDIFMELASSYRKRKRAVRRYPAYYQDA